MILSRSIVANSLSFEQRYERILILQKYSAIVHRTRAIPEIVKILISSLCDVEVVTSISLIIAPIVQAPKTYCKRFYIWWPNNSCRNRSTCCYMSFTSHKYHDLSKKNIL